MSSGNGAEVARKRTRGERAGLSRDSVLDAALELVDRDGLGALTMRGLGAELGVEAMTLYHYVPNKQALLGGLVERVFTGALPWAEDGCPWRASLRAYAETLRTTLLRHPGVLPLVAGRPAVTPGTLHAVERALRTLRAAGFPLGRALDVVNSLSVFVVGHAAAEAAVGPVNKTAGPGSTTDLARLDPAEFPLISEAVRSGEGVDDAARFRFALDALLSGFADDGRGGRAGTSAE
ncbi:TetR/AcrR family transcriptional regulator C-terminal domain-containing protein [Streptomyces netropsis]|uniref:TetR/AcrR family transcriptional regulator C-terminal domain-containing protein n=1 Tax=Streptomyces netropsis TaxID=55404 RepID=UPI0030CED7B4